MDKLGKDNRTRREVDEPDIDITTKKIHKQIAKEKQQQRKPANLADPDDHREQEEVLQQDLRDWDLDPPATVEGQSRNSKDKGVYATCGLWEPETGEVGSINWVQCNQNLSEMVP
jgi:hypothetical protein